MNIEIDDILISLRDKYNGQYRKGDFSEEPGCDFLFNGRQFCVTPWKVSRTWRRGGEDWLYIEGISFSCRCQSSAHLWIIREAKGFLAKWFHDESVRKKGDEIITSRENVSYVFKGKNLEEKRMLFNNSEFVNAVKSLLNKDVIILRLWENWLTFATRNYSEPSIETLDKLAYLFESPKKIKRSESEIL